MNKPVLVVMAAGMGSRYGGMKQIDPVGPNGQVIMDYSLYDARRAGFETVIFVIKHEIEDAFKAAIGDRVAKAMKVKYAFQQLDELPAGFAVPEGRVKPWGTCHAVLAAKPLIDGPFAVINADDYYGPEAFQVMYDYLSTHADDDFYRYCMVSYLLKNTLSENGSVARGVCIKNEDGTLTYTIKIRDDMKFSDGTPITAKNYIASLLANSTNVAVAAGGTGACGCASAGLSSSLFIALRKPFCRVVMTTIFSKPSFSAQFSAIGQEHPPSRYG